MVAVAVLALFPLVVLAGPAAAVSRPRLLPALSHRARRPAGRPVRHALLTRQARATPGGLS